VIRYWICWLLPIFLTVAVGLDRAANLGGERSHQGRDAPPASDERWIAISVADLDFEEDVDAALLSAIGNASANVKQSLDIHRAGLVGPGECFWLDTDQQLTEAAKDLQFTLLTTDGESESRSISATGHQLLPLLIVRTSLSDELIGWLEYSFTRSNFEGFSSVTRKMARFRLNGNFSSPDNRPLFLVAKSLHHAALVSQKIAGWEWFELERDRSVKELGFVAHLPLKRFDEHSLWRSSPALDIFSGSNVVDDNLSLHSDGGWYRVRHELQKDLHTLTGVTVPEFDWQDLIDANRPVRSDPLAHSIPHDQHAIFFPQVASFVTFIEYFKRYGFPLLHASRLDSNSAVWLERYLYQMLIPWESVPNWEGIESIAISGGDPYVQMGSDVSLLLEGPGVAAVHDQFFAAIREAVHRSTSGRTNTETYRDVTISSGVTLDRKISCYVARQDSVLLISNSLPQIKRLIDAHRRETRVLAESNDYLFFRQRFADTRDSETAFLLISDAALRRWCGPQVRIGYQRQLHAHRLLRKAELVLATEVVPPAQWSELLDRFIGFVPGLDSLATDGQRVRSAVYGDLQFLTPISELPFDKGTLPEWQGYLSWRDNYSRRWDQAFDPIGLQLHMTKNELRADLGVMPIADSIYYSILSWLVGDNVLRETPVDQVNQPVYFRIPIGKGNARQSRFIFSIFHHMGPTSWLGEWLTLSIAPDFDDPQAELGRRPQDLPPFVFYFDVQDLDAMNQFIQAWFDDVVDQPDIADAVFDVNGTTCYQLYGISMQQDFFVASMNPMIIATSKANLIRAITNLQEVMKTEEKNLPELATAWTPVSELGQTAYFRMTQASIQSAADYISLLGDSNELRRAAWNHLPILNQWRRLAPDRDPIAIHEERFGIRLTAPDGSGYRWNEKAQSMESIKFGHPGNYSGGRVLLPILEDVESIEFGLTLEHGGLRAKTIIRIKSKP